VPEPIVDRVDATDPEHEALLADFVGLALLVVLKTLNPAERLAFVLHDIFAVPLTRSPRSSTAPPTRRATAREPRAAACGLRTPSPTPTWTLRERSWRPSSRPRATGTSDRLVAVLDPDVVLEPTLAQPDREKSGGPPRSSARLCSIRSSGSS
jgi:hypothetical protein